MDILAIIKENLPDGVEVSEKALKAIEKEIKQQQALEFVPKDQYSKKTSIIDKLENELKELQGKSADGDAYKEKFASLEEEYKNYKATVASEKTTAAKRAAARQALKALGAHDEDLDTFLLDKVDYDKMELDGDKVKDLKAFESYKEQYKRYFGETITIGANVADPPKGDSNAFKGKTATELMEEANRNPDKINEIMSQIEAINKPKKEQ